MNFRGESWYTYDYEEYEGEEGDVDNFSAYTEYLESAGFVWEWDDLEFVGDTIIIFHFQKGTESFRLLYDDWREEVWVAYDIE